MTNGKGAQELNTDPLGMGQPLMPRSVTRQDSVKPWQSALPVVLRPGEAVTLDWGRKRTGYLQLAGDGQVEYELASHPAMLARFDEPRHGAFRGYGFPTFVAGTGHGVFTLPEAPRAVQRPMVALRFVRLRNTTGRAATLRAARLDPTEFPAQPSGSFACSDPAVTRAWRLGVDTAHLCTQPARESQVPLYVPFGKGYVQWDGCRRDREVWGGDLRASALAWYYAFDDQSPIENSLYAILSAQHVSCDEHGLFPGSASTHQKYYEWAMWEIVNLWEYFLHTGSERLFEYVTKGPILGHFRTWCEKAFGASADGWLHTNLSWMYTIPLQRQPLPALQMAAIHMFGALERICEAAHREDDTRWARARRVELAGRVHRAFWGEDTGAYRFRAAEDAPVRTDLCTNAWALLAGLAGPQQTGRVLQRMSDAHWRETGSINIAPPLGIDSPHDETVWPYANAYEAAARLHVGDVGGALEVVRRYTGAAVAAGHTTLPEMMRLDGSLPTARDGTGDTLSFCHAWSALASWALQRYLLGVAPLTPGWRRFRLAPLPAPLEWARGTIPTPHGPVEVELEYRRGVPRGEARYPRGTVPELDSRAVDGISAVPV